MCDFEFEWNFSATKPKRTRWHNRIICIMAMACPWLVITLILFNVKHIDTQKQRSVVQSRSVRVNNSNAPYPFRVVRAHWQWESACYTHFAKHRRAPEQSQRVCECSVSVQLHKHKHARVCCVLNRSALESGSLPLPHSSYPFSVVSLFYSYSPTIIIISVIFFSSSNYLVYILVLFHRSQILWPYTIDERVEANRMSDK